MAGGIYVIQDNSQLVEMKETAYESEDLLQRLLADYPSVLAGDQIDSEKPRRWLLISREMPVPGEDEGAGRWFLDHLFIDQDGVPTLVEVKRRSDTRIRREVVGQMLDYAANAVLYWPVESIRAAFENDRDSPDEDVALLLKDESTALEFWQKVKINLEAGRIRMVFVADEIPTELRSIVEFLNKQMDPAEVLAIEVRQYVGPGMKALVPRLVGQTVEAQRRKSGVANSAVPCDEEAFFDRFRSSRSETEVKISRRIADWMKSRFISIVWMKGGKGDHFGGIVRVLDSECMPVSIKRSGKVSVKFGDLMKLPHFEPESKRVELLDRLNQIEGVDIPREKIAVYPKFPITALASESAFKKFTEVLDWIVQEAKRPVSLAQNAGTTEQKGAV